MIFVAVGTQKFQFNRLLIEIDSLVQEKKIDEKIFAQIGNSDYYPKLFEYTEFLTKEEFNDYIEKCSLLITHGGVGTILSAKRIDKPVLVVPRLKKFNEHVDDHQLEIAQAFKKKNFVRLHEDHQDFESNIIAAKNGMYEQYQSALDKNVKVIDDFLTKIAKK